MSESEISVKVLINKGLYEKLKKESQLYQEHCLNKRNTLINLEVDILMIVIVLTKFQ